jgi:hypothetical protein
VLRAITACNMFEQLNFQKCSGHGVILAFWLRNVLRATATYTFSTSQHPKVLWNRSVFNIFWHPRCNLHHRMVQVDLPIKWPFCGKWQMGLKNGVKPAML